MKYARTLLLIVGAAICCGRPAHSAQALAVSVMPQNNSPIQISECFGGLTDTDVGNINYYVEQSVIFMNTSNRPVVAVRFKFDFYDAFSEHLGERYGTDTGTFSPGALIDHAHNHIGGVMGYWSSINIWPSITAIRCSVDTVRFDDGSIWDAATARPLATPTPHPIPRGTPMPASMAREMLGPVQSAPAASAPKSSVRVSWRDRSRSCEVVVIEGALGRKTTAAERSQLLLAHSALRSTVKVCEQWRLDHP